MSVIPPGTEPTVEAVSATNRIASAIKENQLLTAASIFILWQFDLFNSILGYGCGL